MTQNPTTEAGRAFLADRFDRFKRPDDDGVTRMPGFMWQEYERALAAILEIERQARATAPAGLDEEAIARRFHEAYERLAPSFGYETRRESAVPWEEVPENNRRLMVATVRAALAASGGEDR